MLILERRIGEKIIIGDNEVIVTLLRSDRGRAKIGISAPEDVPVHREEVYKKILKSNEEFNQ
jgi:carbon storage regulator